MSYQLSDREYYEIQKRIQEAGNDINKLRIIRDTLAEYSDDDPKVKELKLTLGR